MLKKGIEPPNLTREELLDIIGYLRSVSPEPEEETLEILPGSKESGQRLFREKGCVTCHSIRGKGGRVGPDLLTLEMRGGVIGLAVAMWNKAPKMMAAMEERNISVPQIKAAEMADLVAYLYSVRYFAQVGNPNNGRKLLNTKGCVSCHSVEGKGGKSAADLGQLKGLDSLADVLAKLWNHISIPSYMERQRFTWPRMSSQEMADLVALLQGASQGRR
ncbi:MAG: c-type cytochrome [Deltaproteobacteria bacterium]|nr:c-type cytochrome [Deltaproteobacteria bacterium]